MESYDVIIVGGGFVGCITAIALAQQGLNIAVVEAKTLEAQQQSDPRGIALNYGSCEFLKSLDAWNSLKPHATAIKKVHVSAKGHFSKLRFTADEAQVEALGYVIEGDKLLNSLLERTLATKNIHWHHETFITDIQAQSGVTLTTKNNETLTATLFIAADGQFSKMRELLNISTTVKSQDQQALLTKVAVDSGHNHMAYERFTKQGTIALLPLPNNHAKLVITGKKALIDEWQHLSDNTFLNNVQALFGGFAGTLSSPGKRITYPLTMLTSNEQVREHIIILGNAAHTLHPIAAQGLNLAVQDIKMLNKLLKKTIARQENIASLETLKTYENERIRAQKRVQQFTQRLTTLKPGVLQSSTFCIINLCSPLKRYIQNQAMGISAS